MKHVKKINLSDIILEEAIRASLTEQPNPDPDFSYVKKNQTAKIAKKIYNAKGLIFDNPEQALEATSEIYSTNFDDVDKALKKLTGGIGIIDYLISFMHNNLKELKSVLDTLKRNTNKASWNKTVYPLGKLLFNKSNSFSTAPGDLKYTEYVSADYLKWYKNQSVKNIDKLATSPLRIMGETLILHRHEALIAASIVTSFIPIISSGIMLLDAELYRREGNLYEAGITAVFALLPGVGPIAKLGYRAIAKLGTRGMSKLGKKVLQAKQGKSVKLNNLESQAINDLIKNDKLAKKELDEYFAQQVEKNYEKLITLPPATKEALRRTYKDNKTKLALVLAKYQAAATVYDYAYWSTRIATPEEIDASYAKYQRELYQEGIQIIDAQINKLKTTKTLRTSNGGLMRIESKKKLQTEAIISSETPGIFDQIFGSAPTLATIGYIVAYASFAFPVLLYFAKKASPNVGPGKALLKYLKRSYQVIRYLGRKNADRAERLKVLKQHQKMIAVETKHLDDIWRHLTPNSQQIWNQISILAQDTSIPRYQAIKNAEELYKSSTISAELAGYESYNKIIMDKILQINDAAHRSLIP